MKKIFLGLFILGCLTVSCQEQPERLETKAMNCVFESYDDKGVAFKKAIYDFEQVLITEKILKDRSGKSYKALFEKIATNNELTNWPITSFDDLLSNIGAPRQEALGSCLATLEKNTINKLEAFAKTIQTSDELTPSILANGILAALDEEDFELNYYKMNTFLLFDTINYTNDKGLIKALPKLEENPTFQTEKAINVYIDGENQFFVNDEKVNLNTLKSKIRTYVSNNESESYIALSSERKTSFASYIDVQNAISAEIDFLRDQFSKEKYNQVFEELTKEQADEIRKVYPFNLSEAVPK